MNIRFGQIYRSNYYLGLQVKVIEAGESEVKAVALDNEGEPRKDGVSIQSVHIPIIDGKLEQWELVQDALALEFVG